MDRQIAAILYVALGFALIGVAAVGGILGMVAFFAIKAALS